MTTLGAALLSVIAGAVVLGLKWVAYYLTGSVALYSDALESLVNVVAATAAWVALWVAGRPADDNHAFGHTKAEYFSAVLEGALILLAAATIVREAWGRLAHPQELEGLDLGLLVSVVASVINAGLGWYLLRRGKAERSPALKADGLHILTDVVTTFGVLAGVGLAWATGWWILDPLLAIVVALNIVWAGSKLVRESLSGLMDEGLPGEEMTALQDALAEPLPGVLEIHDLRTRKAGPVTFVQLHLVVEGSRTVEHAHQLCDELEAKIAARVPGAQVLIHVEPEAEAQHKAFVIRHRQGAEPGRPPLRERG
ncbi:MAG TPA: cation diffusion facilitator family transporter [Thermoanaerobaculia bacterium]|nr:cation diffusion facilitator family transporter [Thermoanaerobaculia bacterium]